MEVDIKQDGPSSQKQNKIDKHLSSFFLFHIIFDNFARIIFFKAMLKLLICTKHTHYFSIAIVHGSTDKSLQCSQNSHMLESIWSLCVG